MKHLRFRMILLACWIVFFYSIEQLFGIISISDTAYIVVLAMMLIVLIFPRIPKAQLVMILITSLIVFYLYKGWIGDLTRTIDVGTMIIEITGIVVTMLLAYWLSAAVNEFENSIFHIMIGHHDKLQETELAGQGFIYREIRRARNHQHPLAMIAIGVNEKSLKFSLDRMIQEAQLSMMNQYQLSKLSNILCNELEDCAVIVQCADHFLVALPETKQEEVPVIIDRLQRRVAEYIGLDLDIGTAMLPNDSYTFEGLVDKATLEMKARSKASSLKDHDQVPSDHPIPANKRG